MIRKFVFYGRIYIVGVIWKGVFSGLSSEVRFDLRNKFELFDDVVV